MSNARYATARAATMLSGFALLSPLAGIAAEIALAWRFGTSATVDAFRIGALLLLAGQQLFVIQILPNAVVPVFAEYRRQGKEKEAWHVALSLGNLLLLPALAVSVLAFLRPEPVVHLLAPGLAGEARVAAFLFVRWLLPIWTLLMWNGMAAGILYAYEIFWVPPAAQLAGNLVLVTAILSFGTPLGAVSLVIGVLLSAAVSSGFYYIKLVALMRQAQARFTWSIDPAHPGVRKMLKLAFPLLGTILLSQWISVAVNRALSTLPSGNVALFGYAWKLGVLVQWVPASLATALFPRLADARFSRVPEEFSKLCARALRMTLFIALPLTCMFYALRFPLVAMLFERGAFSAKASEDVARLFGLLLLGAPATAAYTNLEKIVYAGQRMRLPMYTQLGSALIVTAAARRIAQNAGLEGLTLVVTALAWLTAGTLFLTLKRHVSEFAAGKVMQLASQLLLLGLAAAGFAYQAGRFFQRAMGPGSLASGLSVVSGMALGTFVFLGTALALRIPEATEFWAYLRWQRKNAANRLHTLVFGRT